MVVFVATPHNPQSTTHRRYNHNTSGRADLTTRPDMETWTVGEQFTGGIPLYIGDRHFFTVLPPIGSDDFSRAHLAAAAPDMLSALKAAQKIKERAALKSTAQKLEALIAIGKVVDAAIAKAEGRNV